jgi:hypothetical protein
MVISEIFSSGRKTEKFIFIWKPLDIVLIRVFSNHPHLERGYGSDVMMDQNAPVYGNKETPLGHSYWRF